MAKSCLSPPYGTLKGAGGTADDIISNSRGFLDERDIVL
jgi:hypothetical protein